MYYRESRRRRVGRGGGALRVRFNWVVLLGVAVIVTTIVYGLTR